VQFTKFPAYVLEECCKQQVELTAYSKFVPLQTVTFSHVFIVLLAKSLKNISEQFFKYNVVSNVVLSRTL